MTSNVTGDLSRFLIGLRADDLPKDVAERTKRHVIDCFGVMVAGSVSEPGLAVARSLDRLGETGTAAQVFAEGRTASTASAAWANGTAAHALDFDDTGFSHPTACILPAILGVGEHIEASGQDLLVAMVAGHEAFERIAKVGREQEPELRARGLHPTALYGAAAAAAGVGSLLRVSPEEMAVALGLALSNAGGLNQQYGTWGKGVHAGNAARAGIMGVTLAQEDFWGAEEILEGPYGFFHMLFGPDGFDAAPTVDALGERWAIIDPGLNMKPYPTCGRTLRAIDASLALQAEVDGVPDRIVKVCVDTFPDYIHTLPYRAPTQGFRGKFSLDYAIAISLLDGRVDLGSYSNESANRPELRELLGRITVNEREDWGPDKRRVNPVTVELDDGTSETREVNTPLGSVANPLTREQLAGKFAYCLDAFGVDAVAAASLFERLHTLEELPSVSAFVEDVVGLRH